MGLKLKELQRVVSDVVKKEKSTEILREEITKVLGPTILTTHGLVRMAKSANERLDILEATGRSVDQIKPSLLVKFVDSESAEVRKLVARLIPENFLKTLMKDPSPIVRSEVAKRLPLHLVTEMSRKFPSDDNLKTIQKLKKLSEAGIPDPDVIDEPFDMYGEESFAEMIGDIEHPELSDAWYETQAMKICNTYGGNIEGQWEEIAVQRYCHSLKSMGFEVDQEKLLDAVFDCIEEREEAVLGESHLKSLARGLRFEDTEFMPVISESVDVAKQMITAGYTTNQYINTFEEAFSVRHVTVENPVYRTLHEGAERVTHPISAKLPGSTFRNVDERAVNAYVNAWNTRESIRNNPMYRLQWAPDAEDISMVNFYLELK